MDQNLRMTSTGPAKSERRLIVAARNIEADNVVLDELREWIEVFKAWGTCAKRQTQDLNH
jgi:hypothetical protein